MNRHQAGASHPKALCHVGHRYTNLPLIDRREYSRLLSFGVFASWDNQRPRESRNADYKTRAGKFLRNEEHRFASSQRRGNGSCMT